MNFSLAFLKSVNSFTINTFTPSEISSQEIDDIEQISDLNYQALIIFGPIEDEEFAAGLQTINEALPVINLAELDLSLEQISDLTYLSGKELLEKLYTNWSLVNNIELLDNLFPTLTTLNRLYPNDREQFITMLWEIIQKNLATFDLKLIYNDIQMAQKNSDKNKLIMKVAEGINIINVNDATDIDKQLMGSYKDNFTMNFSITDYDIEKQELVVTAKTKKSPVLIMAKSPKISALQKSLMKALFDGLQDD